MVHGISKAWHFATETWLHLLTWTVPYLSLLPYSGLVHGNLRFQWKVRIIRMKCLTSDSNKIKENWQVFTPNKDGWSEDLRSEECLPGSEGVQSDIILPSDYNDVVMSAMACQITGVSIVCSNVCSCADQRKHQSFASLAFVRGIHRWPVNSPHIGPVTRKMFAFDDVIIMFNLSHLLTLGRGLRMISRRRPFDDSGTVKYAQNPSKNIGHKAPFVQFYTQFPNHLKTAVRLHYSET